MKSTHMILLLMSVMACRAEVPLGGTSFEKDSDLAHFSGTGFAVVADRAQFGSKSLKWGGGILTVSNIGSLSPEESGAKYGAQFPVSPTFVMSLYNEAPAEEVLRIEFNGTVHFDLQLNFKGWRTVWVPFYEMQGDVPEAGSPYDVHSARLIAPETAGALWIDDLVFSQYIDDRHAYPDLQVPFIKNGGAGVWDHWMPKLDHWKRIAAVTPDPVTPLVFKELETIRLRLIDEYFKKSKQLFGADWYRSKLVDDGILAEDGAVGFSPVPLRLDVQVSPVRYELGLDDKPEYIVVRPFGIRMLQLANEYRSTVDLSARAELGRVYAAACHYVLDQGWCAGSSLGTMHHFGYQLRELMTSFFLMKEVLAEEGLLDDIGDTTLWMLDCGEMLMPQETFEANLDYYNTQSAFRLMVALLPADPGRQSALLKAYSAHLSYSLALTDSTGGFKPDGTAWHHWGHYPAYATGAFDRIPITFYALSGTSFRIDEAGHSNFKKAMLAATLYSNPFCYGLGQAGRHPLGGSIKSLGEAYLKLALSGTPDGAEPLDAEVAAAYQRLWGVPNDQVAKALFATCNLNTEPPNGHWTFPYAALSVHRRADWSVNIKGYSKYVWASEIYNLDNRYGRYQSSGVVQVLPNLSQKEAGYTEDGWDWNHPPGATTIARPFAEPEPEAPLPMFKSEESYAGGCSLDGNGVWAMKLNEGDGFTIDPVKEKMSFPGKLKARKSVFCFGEQILCLGSGIESDDPSAPVHTTLFQNSIKPIDGAVRREGDWLFDPIGNGYKILDGAEPVITVGEQSSPNNKYSLRKGEGKKGAKADASGLFAKAWIDHGAASKNASYAYVVFPMVGTSAPRDTPFSIRRQDNQAHVVEWESTTAYACFEAGGL
ncbi:MAG: hypothetical protein H8E53_07180, partial [Planctomycetes bacterium]|nr:hypothetical protein [Planctomycetota bacterium]